MIASIVMIGRRWFDGCNTYTTTEVVVTNRDGSIVNGKTSLAIGYGDYYIQAGTEWLVSEGLFPKEAEGCVLWQYCRENNIAKFCTVADVSKKKDL